MHKMGFEHTRALRGTKFKCAKTGKMPVVPLTCLGQWWGRGGSAQCAPSNKGADMSGERRMGGERAMMEVLEDRRLMSAGGMLVLMGDGSVRQEATSGRITGIAVDPSDPSGNTIYVSTVGGGVWK
jgi:hypothetical protein